MGCRALVPRFFPGLSWPPSLGELSLDRGQGGEIVQGWQEHPGMALSWFPPGPKWEAGSRSPLSNPLAFMTSIQEKAPVLSWLLGSSAAVQGLLGTEGMCT